MRITGYGAGFGQDSGNRDRAAAFRAKHSIGQRIKGRILRREQNDLYWVQVGGEELLARLEVQASPGDQLMFIVRALTPEIQLQALTPGMSAGDLPGLVQRFRAAREVFEIQDAALFATLQALPPQPGLRHEAFRQALATQPDSALRLAKVDEILEQINASLGVGMKAVALYEPWNLPWTRRLEMLRQARAGGFETALSAVEISAGSFEARLSVQQDDIRLMLGRTNPRPAARSRLS